MLHFFFFFCTLVLSSLWTSRGHRCRPLPPVLAFNCYRAYRVQQSHCSSNFHRALLTYALALSASQFVHKKSYLRIYTSMHSGGFELTKLTHTRLEDNLIRHRGDRYINHPGTSQRSRLVPTFFAPQALHLSRSLITLPSPRQLEHALCSCCTMPGPICRNWTCMPPART